MTPLAACGSGSRFGVIRAGYDGGMKIPFALARLLALGALLSVTLPAHAVEEAVVTRDDQGYLIGGSLASSSSHIGHGKVSYDFKPMWAFQLGPVRVSRSRARSLMGAGKEQLETGLSTQLDVFSDWKLGVSLRLDNGRSFDGDPDFAGLPDVRTTARLRLSTGRPLTDRWSWNASVDQDILGHQGGMRLSQGFGYHLPVSDKTYWDLSLSSTWGNGRYLQTQYGISQAAAQATGREAFLINSGWESFRAGAQLTHVINKHWVAFGGVDLSRLLRSAANSPLVGRVTTHSVSVGLAYRSK
jgi:MipA family protein